MPTPTPPSASEEQLHRLVSVFLAENTRLNLSAFRTEESCWIGNILDSLAFLDLNTEVLRLPFRAKGPLGPNGTSHISCIDIGTGGGFPLLPLAICLPDVHFNGLDATRKKIDAVSHIVQYLKLSNVQLITGRAEEVARNPDHRACYDLVLSKAVASLPTLLEYCSPFAKVRGHLVLWKSMNIEEELRELTKSQKELCCALIETHTYELPGNFGKRQLLVFQKTAPLSLKYPREVGVPKKKPLH